MINSVKSFGDIAKYCQCIFRICFVVGRLRKCTMGWKVECFGRYPYWCLERIFFETKNISLSYIIFFNSFKKAGSILKER